VARTGLVIVCPLHPRTRAVLRRSDQGLAKELRIIDPVSYYDMLALLSGARLVLTDSGGVQREAYMLGVDCVTLRDETEWIELLDTGKNWLAGADGARIAEAAGALLRRHESAPAEPLYGDGDAATRIARVCAEWGRLA